MEAEAYIRKKFPQGIPRLGADALRFAFLRHKLIQVDVQLDIVKWADEGRQFCNKLWNAVRYTQFVLNAYAEIVAREGPSSGKPAPSGKEAPNSPDDQTLVERFEEAKRIYHTNMETHELHVAFNAIYSYIERDLCDVYLVGWFSIIWFSQYYMERCSGDDQECPPAQEQEAAGDGAEASPRGGA